LLSTTLPDESQAQVVADRCGLGVGHHDHLHRLALAARDKRHVVGHDRRVLADARRGVRGAVAFLHGGDGGIEIIGVRRGHHVVARDASVLLGAQRGDRVADPQAADHERRAPRDAADGHERTLLVAEEVARRHLVEKAQVAPDDADAFEQDA